MSPRHLFRACAAAAAALSTALAVLVGFACAAAATADRAAEPAAATAPAPAPRHPGPLGFYTTAAYGIRVVEAVPQHRPHHRLRDLAPRRIGRILAHRAGWRGAEWRCLDALWTRESHWRIHDTNAHSGAYGIPQSLPADKMASVGANWRDDPVTQIRWGLHYIGVRYGSPCAAWSHSQDYGYY